MEARRAVVPGALVTRVSVDVPVGGNHWQEAVWARIDDAAVDRLVVNPKMLAQMIIATDTDGPAALRSHLREQVAYDVVRDALVEAVRRTDIEPVAQLAVQDGVELRLQVKLVAELVRV